MIRSADFGGSELLREGPATLDELLDYKERVRKVSAS